MKLNFFLNFSVITLVLFASQCYPAFEEMEIRKPKNGKANTLELFVMSQCPFGQNAEVTLIDFIDNLKGVDKPRLEIKYIFYERVDEGKTSFTALHEEGEVHENLIQMLIRDQYPRFFLEYVKRRTINKAPWYEIAAEVGMSRIQIEAIVQRVHGDQEELIREEYEYATEKYGIFDGSPSFVWEGKRIKKIQEIPIFQPIAVSKEGACSH